jgi:hypothetical protein
VTVRDEIFPAERRLDYVQTEWAEGWTASAAGFGYAAEFLTKHAAAFGATIDQAGLAVFFLQRHRVELVLKNLLRFLEVDFKPSHSLRYLWNKCEPGFSAHSGLDWAEFEEANGDFVQTLIEADDGATTFRFPVDRDGQEVDRPRFIDLEALNRHADTLISDADGCMDFVWAGKQAEAEMESDYAPDWDDL